VVKWDEVTRGRAEALYRALDRCTTLNTEYAKLVAGFQHIGRELSRQKLA
jgi:hypothetical protein